ncbi:putative baseplate assembly protein [soil metagenome]
MNGVFRCCDDDRRAAVAAHGVLNGMDWLQVVDRDAPAPADRQRFLRVSFIKPPAALAVSPTNVRVEGGERIPLVDVIGTSFDGDVLVVEVAEPGDFSRYTLRLVDAADHSLPLAGIDPVLSAIDFSFKVECDTRFDCEQSADCPSQPRAPLDIDYLARDYPALRQLLLDRLSVLAPGWSDRSPADLGIALIELLAYVGDRLSYQQDAVATEAYIGTARSRISVRRHARLIDYRMHDGCNARTWVHVEVGASMLELPAGTRLITAVPRRPPRLPAGALDDIAAGDARPIVFETMHTARLFADQNELCFYTWGGARCCLPRGATRATLAGHCTSLTLVDSARQVLVFEEVKGPRSGRVADADRSHRHAVRLTRVTLAEDPAGGQLHADAAQRSDAAVPVTLIEWAEEDALPFPLCISAAAAGVLHENVSVARGNIVLADHGETRRPRPLTPAVPQPAFAHQANTARDMCDDAPRAVVAPRYQPTLPEGPVTLATPYDADAPPPAGAALRQDPARALHVVTLRTSPDPLLPVWRPDADLLAAGPADEVFTVEQEEDGGMRLRFGDGERGRRPPPGETFTATYRIGTGTDGNIGGDAIAHVLSDDIGLVSVRNPLPAIGGTAPESMEHVRQTAPAAFRTQERAVTPDDYAAVARAVGGVQHARATPRWTGSWRTMVVTLDPAGGEAVEAKLRERARTRLDRYRMAGTDVAVRRARYVALEIALAVCAEAGHVAADVERDLAARLGAGTLPDGTRALFHPDNLTFGRPVWLSQVYGAARNVPGVASVHVTAFRRQGDTGSADLDAGRIELDTLELPRLANDPNFPERGVLRITVQGGR